MTKTSDDTKPAFVPPSRTSLPNAKTVASPKKRRAVDDEQRKTSAFSMSLPKGAKPKDTEKEPSMPGLTEVSGLQLPTETESRSKRPQRSATAAVRRPPPSPQSAAATEEDRRDEDSELSVFSAAVEGRPPPTRTASPHALKTAPDTLVEESPLTNEAAADEPATPAVPALPLPSFKTAVKEEPASAKKAMRMLALPIVGAVVLLGIGAVLVQVSSRATKGSAGEAFVDPDKMARERDADAELRALERERVEQKKAAAAAPRAQPAAEVEQAPVEPAAAQPGAVAQDPPIVAPTVDERPKPARPAARREGGSSTAPDPWAERYGTRTDFNQSAVAASTAGAQPAADKGAETAGVRVPVRLEGAIASSPTGPVIAVVTSATKVGATELPVGTLVHGQTSGTSGSRILVQFSFAVVGGRNVALKGSALGLDGRSGIPGQKSLGGVSDVGAGAVSGATQAVGEGLADMVGDNPAGAAVRGATSPGAQKGARLNNEEDLVTTKRGARFSIYVDAG